MIWEIFKGKLQGFRGKRIRSYSWTNQTAYVLPLRELFGLVDVPWAHHKAELPVPTTKEENSGIHKITALGLGFPGLELQRSFFSDN